jgi:hypothetical protein
MLQSRGGRYFLRFLPHARILLNQHKYIYIPPTTTFTLNNFNIKLFVWWRNVIHESIYKGHHTFMVQLELCYGMILLIVFDSKHNYFFIRSNTINWKSYVFSCKYKNTSIILVN